MLQGLKAADGNAKLHPLFEPGHGTSKDFFHAAQHFRGERHTAAIKHFIQPLPGGANLADNLFRGDGHACETDIRGIAAVSHERTLNDHPGRIPRQQNHAEPFAAVALATAARDH